jgi:hypothetical protein
MKEMKMKDVWSIYEKAGLEHPNITDEQQFEIAEKLDTLRKENKKYATLYKEETRLKLKAIDMGIALQIERDKLKGALEEAILSLCSLCKIVNPHHKDCTSCTEIETYRASLPTTEGTDSTGGE